ncbi:MAG TPA: pentapeptide repeat-containing protein [Xanthobacteraceae bacterium]
MTNPAHGGFSDAEGFELDVRGAFLRRTDLSFANLERANLSGADFSNALLRGANFKDANLEGTILKGADLTDARNLTRSQIAGAVIDEHTKLPRGLSADDSAVGG